LRLRTFAIAAALLLVATVSFGQSGTLRGKILKYDGTPAVGATVTLLHPQFAASDTLDVDNTGMFYIHDVTASIYTLQVQYGKKTQYFKVTVRAQQYTDLRPIKLKR
jgi:hypothetical protein